MIKENRLTKIFVTTFILSVVVMIILKSLNSLHVNSIGFTLFITSSISLVGLVINRNK